MDLVWTWSGVRAGLTEFMGPSIRLRLRAWVMPVSMFKLRHHRFYGIFGLISLKGNEFQVRSVLSLLGVIISNIGICCSCVFPSPIDEDDYNGYQLILKGKVIEVVKSGNMRVIALKVTRYYKGTLRADTARIKTPWQEGMCGIKARVGEDWLFFAYVGKYDYTSHLCTRSKNMSPKAWDYREDELKQDLEFLEDKLRNPTPPKLPFIKLNIQNRQPVTTGKK